MPKWWLARQGLSVLALPVIVVVVIPAWMVRSGRAEIGWPSTTLDWTSAALGLAVLVAGLLLFVACLTRFASDGKGTLAPWDPPVRLVVRGPYAYVRNPMISGVMLMLIAEGLLLRSLPHLEWAGLFFVINAVYIPLLEEPRLKARFGRGYEEYMNAVPRLLPRLRAWRRVEE